MPKFNVTITKGIAEYEVEAETLEQALNICDEWYNERIADIQEVKENNTGDNLFV